MTNKFLHDMASDDFIWQPISQALIGKTKRNAGRFGNICCPMCISMGTTPDRRYRCGVVHDSQGIGINCFNCKFTARFSAGNLVSNAMKQFMLNIGMDDLEVKRISHHALSIRSLLSSSDSAEIIRPVYEMQIKALPKDARPIDEWMAEGCNDDNFLKVVQLLIDRGETVYGATTYYWSPDTTDGLCKRLIIPCLYNGEVVGWTGRSIDPLTKVRYLNQIPQNFLFNTSALDNRNRTNVVLVEGIFDALALDAVGTFGSSLNDYQINWIRNSEKTVIVLPDRDVAGQNMIDIALLNDWSVAFPRGDNNTGAWWDADIKDADEAVRRYGRLYTLQSVMANATSNKMKIAVYRKFMLK